MKKTIRKSLALLLAVLMLMTVSPMSFAKPGDPHHTHTYTAVSAWLWDTTDYSSCAAKVVCSDSSCGEIAHLTAVVGEDTDAYQAATCTAPGKRVVVAEVTLTNGTKVSDNHEIEIPAVGHNFKMSGEGSVAVSNNDNTHSYKCVNPGCTAVGIMKEVTVDEETKTVAEVNGKEPCSGGTPSCTTKAKCDVCGDFYGEDPTHNMTDHPAVAVTCKTDGRSAYWYCDKCETYFSDVEGKNPIEEDSWVIPALGGEHELAADWDYEEGFDCTVGGIKMKKCTKVVNGVACGYVETEEVAADSHVEPDKLSYIGKNGAEFNCTVGGKSYKECKLCHTHYEETNVPAGRHDMEGVQKVDATCEEAGHNAYQVCKVCGFEDGKVVIPKKNHKFVHRDAQESTCTVPGNPEYWECENCGLIARDELGTERVLPDKDANGKITKTALQKLQEEVEPAPHTFAVEPAYPAVAVGCDHAGRKPVLKCTGCEQLFVTADPDKDGKYDDDCVEVNGVMYKIITDVNDPVAIIKALGHDWYKDTAEGSVGYVAPTCKAAGQCIQYCKRPGCKAKETITLEKLPHTKKVDAQGHVDQGVYHKATCEEDSYFEFVCANKDCGQTFREPGVEKATGHDLTGQPMIVAKEPTCTEMGWHGRQCKHEGCSYILEEVQDIPMSGHNWETETVPATCDADGYTREVCANCKAEQNKVILKGGHVDNGNGYCERCGIYISCSHICHKTDAFSKFIWFIMNVWNQFLGINQKCNPCGALHYTKAGDLVVPT